MVVPVTPEGSPRAAKDRIQVWLRPLGNGCRVRVEGREGADLVRGRLPPSVTATEPLPFSGTPDVAFRATFGPDLSPMAFERLIAAMPDVAVMVDPA